MTESELINKALNAAKGGVLARIRSNSAEYEAAIKKAVAYGLITQKPHSLTEEGYKAIDAGGFDQWLSERNERSNKPAISISGNAVIGDNNRNISQGRDFLNNRSPIIKNSPQAVQPTATPEKKASHEIWDKIKYISVIIGGVSGLLLAAYAVAKHWGWM